MIELRFECQRGCIACCDQEGWVYITEDDLRKAAKFLGMTASAFERKYVYRTSRRMRLRKPPDRQCTFLSDAGCSIHPAKPTQCRLFPFWPELVEKRSGWASAAKFCPGIGQGELIQIGSAVEIASEMRTAYPYHYPER